MTDQTNKHSGNPILPGRGLCDPHVRIYNDRAYLYATHDKSPDNTGFVMEDWWVWSSPDLVEWEHECTIRPEQTYYGQPDRSCWAVDAMERDGKYYLYFSRGPREIGVIEADSPAGPWRDPLGKPLIPRDLVDTEARDPGLFKDDDGECYIVFGTWDFYIARLNPDMVSLAEAPRKIMINNPEGPYGKGKTDDKPYLHKHNGIYYLSWGCYYGMSQSVYGPYDCRGSLILPENIAPAMRETGEIKLDHDRHGSFFSWRGQWYFICNDMSRGRSGWFRDSVLCCVHYQPSGEIKPLQLDEAGVCPPPGLR